MGNRLLFRFIALLSFCLLAFGGFGLHIKGGWMYYTHMGVDNNGNNLYKITLKVYRDCAPPNPGQNDPNINITVFNNNTNAPQSIPASLVSSYRLEKTDFSPCINPRPQVCYVILQYETGTFSLPPNGAGYTAAFQRCCRINGIVNVTQPSNALGNTYTLTIPGTSADAGAPKNSSPVFNENDTVVVCYNSSISLDYGATDPDKDSLVFFFTNAINGASQNSPNPGTATAPPYPSLNYVNPFSAEDPFGTGLVINARTGLITGMSPSISGEYVVSVGIQEYRNGRLIATTRKELHVNVANCSLAAAELPVRITSCDGYTVQFENLSSSPAILTYFWDFGVNGISSDTSRLARPSYTYPDTGVFRGKLIVNKESACADSAETEVRVFPGFFPGFSTDGSCFSNPFLFQDTTNTRYGNVDFWRWDFGDPGSSSDTSLSRNPQYKYSQPGNYNASLIVGTNKGCLDTVLVPIAVLDRPLLTLPFRDTLICSIDSLPLLAIGTGSFNWTPKLRMVNDLTPNPTVFPVDSITYTVTLNDRGCIATDSIRVNVLDFIAVDAGPDTTICRTDGVRLRPVTDGLSFAWSPANLLNDASIRNPVATPANEWTTFTVVANLGKCQATDSVRVRTVPYPVANAGPDTTVCFGDAGIVRGTMVGSSFAWSPRSALTTPDQLTSVVNSNQTISMVLTVLDTIGCPKPFRDTAVVIVRPKINVFAGNDTSIVYGQTLQFNGVSNGLIHQWSPGIGLSGINLLDPRALFTDGTLPAGQEEVRYLLTSTTPEGCIGSDEMVVKIFRTGPSIFVPSGFTPNGDGRNDIIRPILAGMQNLDMFRVYNRYGQLIYETNTIGRGWDGRINGALQSSGAFVYQAQATDFTGKPVTKSGTFVLIR